MFDSKSIHSLNDTEAKIYRHVIDHLDDIFELGVRELANNTFTSTATVIRMYKKLGCKSFNEFKQVLISYFRNEAFSSEKEYKRLSEDLQFALTDVFHDQIIQGANLIQLAHTILVFGVGKSGAIAAYGARYLSNVGHFALAVQDLNYPPLLHCQDDDVVIAVSESGETEVLIQQMNNYRENNVKIIAITAHSQSSLAGLADFVITYQTQSYILPQTYSLTSAVGAIYIFERLGIELFKRDKSILKTSPRF